MGDDVDLEAIGYSVTNVEAMRPRPGGVYNNLFEDLGTVDFWIIAAIAGAVGNAADRGLLAVLRCLSREGREVLTEAEAITVARRAAERRLQNRGFPALGTDDISGVAVTRRGPGRWDVLLSGSAIVISVRVDHFEPRRRGISNEVAILRHPALQKEREEQTRLLNEWRESKIAELGTALKADEPPSDPTDSA